MDKYSIKQLSVFIENKQGELSDITSLLSKNSISLKSINLVDTSEFGILRLLVDDENATKKLLDDNGFSLTITNVFAVKIENCIGSFDNVVKILSSNSIDIEYTYTINNAKTGAFIFKVDAKDFDKAVEFLYKANIELVEDF